MFPGRFKPAPRDLETRLQSRLVDFLVCWSYASSLGHELS